MKKLLLAILPALALLTVAAPQTASARDGYSTTIQVRGDRDGWRDNDNDRDSWRGRGHHKGWNKKKCRMISVKHWSRGRGVFYTQKRVCRR